MNTYELTLSNSIIIYAYGLNYLAAIKSCKTIILLASYRHIVSHLRVHTTDTIGAQIVMASNIIGTRRVAIEVINKALPVEEAKI